MSEKKRYYGEVLASRIYGGKEGQKTVGLRFEPKEAVWLAKCLVEASLQVSHNKTVDIKAVRKPRKDEKYTVTVTAP